jgi:hypothetical protein
VEKYGRTRQDTDENRTHAHCILYTFRILENFEKIQNTHFILDVSPKLVAFILWKNMVEPDGRQTRIGRMRTACSILSECI